MTFTDIDSMKTYSFLWNENNGEKANCEAATAQRMFLQAKKSEGVEHVNLFCNRCGGQNQNRAIFMAGDICGRAALGQ